MAASASWSGNAAVNYVSVSISGSGISYGLSLSQSGSLFGTVGTGNVSVTPSYQASFGHLNKSGNISSQDP